LQGGKLNFLKTLKFSTCLYKAMIRQGDAQIALKELTLFATQGNNLEEHSG